jgi:hypothetical protein
MDKDQDLAYTDRSGRRNYEYVSLGCDTMPALKGRTPIQCYGDFMRAFRDHFATFMGNTIVVRVYFPSSPLLFPASGIMHVTSLLACTLVLLNSTSVSKSPYV